MRTVTTVVLALALGAATFAHAGPEAAREPGAERARASGAERARGDEHAGGRAQAGYVDEQLHTVFRLNLNELAPKEIEISSINPSHIRAEVLERSGGRKVLSLSVRGDEVTPDGLGAVVTEPSPSLWDSLRGKASRRVAYTEKLEAELGPGRVDGRLTRYELGFGPTQRARAGRLMSARVAGYFGVTRDEAATEVTTEALRGSLEVGPDGPILRQIAFYRLKVRVPSDQRAGLAGLVRGQLARVGNAAVRFVADDVFTVTTEVHLGAGQLAGLTREP